MAAGCWLLVTDCWLLAPSCWLLTARCHCTAVSHGFACPAGL